MQAELLMILTCAGYLTPYVWDRYKDSLPDSVWCAIYGIHHGDHKRAQRQEANRVHNLPNGEYLVVPEGIQFRELTLKEGGQLKKSLSAAIRNSGGSAQAIILPQRSPNYDFCTQQEWDSLSAQQPEASIGIRPGYAGISERAIRREAERISIEVRKLSRQQEIMYSHLRDRIYGTASAGKRKTSEERG